MAGLAKPNVDNLGSEGYITVLKFTGKGSANGLFDGNLDGSASAITTAYWYPSEYIEFSTLSEINIWRCGMASYSQDYTKFSIFRYENEAYVDVTKNVVQTSSMLNNTKWEKTIEKLPAGRYKFQASSYRGDSEWFIENTSELFLKQGNQYYTIRPEYYNLETHKYNPIDNLDFSLSSFEIGALFNEVAIGDETFKPIDKFNNFQLITNNKLFDFRLLGLKSYVQLIVAKDNILTSVAHNIDYFKLMSNTTDINSVKLVLSIDSGITWKTWNTVTSNFEDLTLTIPTTPYANMTEDDLTQWNNAMEVISINGIDATTFNELDFNLLNSKTIRFAYVLSRPTYSDTAETSELQWQFDAKGSLRKMSDSEHYVDVYEQQIKVTPLIDNALVKVNVMV